MGVTSVEIDEETKARLEELRAEIRLETGENVTQQELLDRIVAGASRDELIDAFDDEFEGLDEEERERFHSGTSDWGVDTADDDVDEILYVE